MRHAFGLIVLMLLGPGALNATPHDMVLNGNMCVKALTKAERRASEELRSHLREQLEGQRASIRQVREIRTDHFFASLAAGPGSALMTGTRWGAPFKQLLTLSLHDTQFQRLGPKATEYFSADLSPQSTRPLPPRLALMRVYRDLDKSLSDSQQNLINQVFRSYALEQFITTHLLPQFETREGPAERATWELAPSVAVARQKYRKLLDQVRAQYQHLTKRQMFEELVAAMQNPAQNVIRITDSGLFQGMESNRVTYEDFLLRLHGNNHKDFTIETLRGLRLILEISEVVQDPIFFRSYLEDLLVQHLPLNADALTPEGRVVNPRLGGTHDRKIIPRP